MKIVKEGEIPNYLIYRVTCQHCKTEIEFFEGEGEEFYDGLAKFITIKCPLCKSIVEVPKRNRI